MREDPLTLYDAGYFTLYAVLFNDGAKGRETIQCLLAGRLVQMCQERGRIPTNIDGTIKLGIARSKAA